MTTGPIAIQSASGYRTNSHFVLKTAFLKKREELKDQSDYMITLQNSRS